MGKKLRQTIVTLGVGLLAINENNGCVHLTFLTYKWNTVRIGPRSTSPPSEANATRQYCETAAKRVETSSTLSFHKLGLLL